MKKGFISIISISIVLLIWQLIAIYINQPQLIPSVSELIRILISLLSTEVFYQSVVATLLRGLAGMLLSLIASSLSAFFITCHELLYELFRPLLIIMRSVPVISFILLALLFLKPEGVPLMIAFLTMYPLLTENLIKGIKNMRPGLLVMADQFKINRRNKLIQIIYPQIKPFLFSGLSSAAGFGWRAIIMGEVLSQCIYGIGGEMKRAQNFIAVPELVAWTSIAVVISFVFDMWIRHLGQIRLGIIFNNRKMKDPATGRKTSRLITVLDLKFKYGNTEILSDFSYTFSPGQIYGIQAPSGAGKTTLLSLINGTLIPLGGSIYIDKSNGIASVFQEPELLPQLTTLQNVSLPLSSTLSRAESEKIAFSALEEMELETFANRYPDELSFGQQQRVAIARALAYTSPVMCMDEPFRGLDEALTFRIIDRIRKRQCLKKQIILFTSHNPEELNRMADEIINLRL